jgi:hypothetical protein
MVVKQLTDLLTHYHEFALPGWQRLGTLCHSEPFAAASAAGRVEEPAFSRQTKLTRSAKTSPIRTRISCTQQASYATQTLPRGLIQRWLGAHQVADHLPRRHIQRAFGGKPHRQRHRTLRAETYPLRRRLLARPDPNRLREHIDRDRFISCLNLAPAAQAKYRLHVPSFQEKEKSTILAVPPRAFTFHYHAVQQQVRRKIPGA